MMDGEAMDMDREPPPAPADSSITEAPMPHSDAAVADVSMADGSTTEADQPAAAQGEQPSGADIRVVSAAAEEAQAAAGQGDTSPVKPPHGSARAQAVKLADGDPILRNDLQHNLLAHLFGDTTRCFTNPRPGIRAEGGAGSDKFAKGPPDVICAPAFPEGQAEGTTRRSDETPEEYAAWKDRLERYKASKKKALERAKAAQEAQLAAEDGAPAPVSGQAAEPHPAANAPDEEEWPQNGAEKLTFKELYLESLVTSSKCTKSVRANLLNDPIYAEALAKVCFLLNVGRMNTTLAFYPEMKTMLRSYHAIPSIQTTETTRRSLQDSPRLKALLKSQQLANEKPGATSGGPPPSAATIAAARAAQAAGLQEAPATLDELVAERFVKQRLHPPTSIISLVFLLCTHAEEVAQLHFSPPVDGWALLFPDPDAPIPSGQRTRAFLWLTWHYLEGGAALPPGGSDGSVHSGSAACNPFADEHSLRSVEIARKVWGLLAPAEQDEMHKHGRWRGVPAPLKAEMFKDDAAYEEARQLAEAEGEATAEGKGEGKDVAAVATTTNLLFRIRAPRVDVVAPEAIAQENVDTPEELEFGEAMQRQRTEFVNKIVEETSGLAAGDAGEDGSSSAPSEALAAAAATAGRAERGASGSPAPGAIGNKGKLKRLSTGGASGSGGAAAASLKKRMRAQAAANSSAAAAAISKEEVDTPSKSTSFKVTLHSKKDKGKAVATATLARESRGADKDDEEDDEDDHDDTRSSSIAPSTEDILEKLWHKPLLSPSLALPGRDSMSRQAWRRILERAAQGIGDASYNSDNEEQADYEAKDDRVKPKLELARMLHCIRNSRVVTSFVEGDNDRAAQ
ncbi:hypothetical protein K437DRAFT_260180 [Tilletiaria anomala UBC 951]|uniref:Uncharacterized protein n=1 Tax=Tilletiaria anomala (strain ATCC 24038 / CBS 436.72 / UBC 951) TaxID=1037660 RepID=A0A066V4C4_TILAU|nr:uncharacterized protein K437DRAFT_260180 [Tilletiaria anomala UBC 951]KDN36286.1 hypothetical protein K437DRAFT_260180 [Tilletiaria anomala UBC 951]